MPVDLLLEIGCEELPASFVVGAVDALPSLVTKKLDALRITHGDAKPLGSPRRIALVVRGLAERQPDLSEELTGPPASAAFDKEGKPTKGAEAFAKKLGVDVAQLKIVETPKGKYVAGTRKEIGRASKELLPALLVEAIREIPFRKSMRWGAGDFAFGRPIHWIVALLGDDVVELELAGVKSGRKTYGHRFLAPSAVSIPNAASYVESLRPAHVFVDLEERSKLMVARLHEIAGKMGGSVLSDDFLVGENVGLVEEPFVIDGSFEPAFLDLPRTLVVDVMRTHQRYFAVTKNAGDLSTMLPRYLAVVNTAQDPDRIRKGNDRVLRARLKDAAFFVETDRKTGLDAYAKKLEGIRYHGKLGTVADKSARMQRIAHLIVDRLQLPEKEQGELRRRIDRASKIAKADLASLTVGEFPEMQGHAGRDFAEHAGEDAEVALAIEQHWLASETIDGAFTRLALLVALADKFDHLVGGFAVGLAPTGANDAFGMRRAFLRAVSAHLEGSKRFSLVLPSLLRIAEYAYQAYMESTTPLPRGWNELEPELVAFMKTRLVGLFEKAAPRDIVEAVLEADPAQGERTSFEDLRDVEARILALKEVRRMPSFVKFATAFKRAANITKGVAASKPDASKFDHPAERALWNAFLDARQRIESAADSHDYFGAFGTTATALADEMDTFFDKDKGVFVMAEDLAVRENRLRMLATIAGALRRVARLELLEGSA